MDVDMWSAIGTTAGGLIGFWLANKYDWLNMPISEVLARRKRRKLASQEAQFSGEQGVRRLGHGGIEKPPPES